MKTDITIQGGEQITRRLKDRASLFLYQEAVKQHTSRLDKSAKRNAQFRGHHRNGKWITPTGYTRTTIRSTIEGDGMVGRVWVEAEHAPYLEFGTRYMDAQPFLGPAYEQESRQFLETLRRAMEGKR